jgi:hypothetical protein
MPELNVGLPPRASLGADSSHAAGTRDLPDTCSDANEVLAMNVEGEAGASLFWELAEALMERPEIGRGTMMGYPCLRNDGAFFACVEPRTGHLLVKLPASRVNELVASGQAIPFSPNGRTFREWAAVPVPDRTKWAPLLDEARSFTRT